MAFGDAGHHISAGPDCLIEHRVWIFDGEDHPDRSCSLDFGNGVGVVLDPEHRAIDRELGDGEVPIVTIQSVHLDSVEGAL